MIKRPNNLAFLQAQKFKTQKIAEEVVDIVFFIEDKNGILIIYLRRGVNN